MTGRNNIRFRVRREGNGFAVAGRRFYVWDEDRESAIRAAVQLDGGNLAHAQAKRLLYYPDDVAERRPRATDDSEALDA